VNIEQFSAWHNVPIGTKANGLDGFDTVLTFNSPQHVKHLQNLMDLQKGTRPTTIPVATTKSEIALRRANARSS